MVSKDDISAVAEFLADLQLLHARPDGYEGSINGVMGVIINWSEVDAIRRLWLHAKDSQ